MRSALLVVIFSSVISLTMSSSLTAQTPFTIAGVTAAPGSMASGSLAIPSRPGDEGTTVPFTIVNGAKPGPVLMLTAGVHGYEYPPILALQRLRERIDPHAVSGTILMVHVANMPSYLKRTIYYSPVDGKNLNRVFPGKADGTLSERIAYAITREMIDRADALVDLHCGDGNESLRPYAYWVTTGPGDVAKRGRDLVLAFGLDHIVIDNSRPTDPAASIYLSNTAILKGKPAVTIESGGLGASDEESIARIEQGIAGVMKHLKMTATGPDPVAHPIWIGRSLVITSQATGLFRAAVDKGTTVAEGTLLGTITDFWGKTVQEIRAPFAGEVLYVLGTPPINAGEPVAFVGERQEK